MLRFNETKIEHFGPQSMFGRNSTLLIMLSLKRAGGMSCMLWSHFSSAGTGTLVKVKRIMTSISYKSGFC